MAEFSAISWTDHTWNPWRGCTKVGPGCDFCYAESRDIQYESGKDATAATHWGPGAPRIRAKVGSLGVPYKLVRDIARGKIPPNQNKVFALSLGDFADNEVETEWRTHFWHTIRETPQLRYLLVTKRIGNVDKMLPFDWGPAYSHVGVIATTVDQDEVDRDLPKLIALKEKRGISWVGLSIEPQLGRVLLPRENIGLDWAITGGESLQLTHAQQGARPRPYDVRWVDDLLNASAHSGTAIFVKQLGGHPLGVPAPRDGMGKKPEEWPEWMRVQDFPAALR